MQIFHNCESLLMLMIEGCCCEEAAKDYVPVGCDFSTSRLPNHLFVIFFCNVHVLQMYCDIWKY